MKKKFLFLLIIFILLGSLGDCSKAKSNDQYSLKVENKNQRIERLNQQNKESHLTVSKIIDINKISELLTTICLVFKSALCDKSFLIIMILFANYEWRIVFISSLISITVIEFITIFANLGRILFNLQEWIDVIAVCFYIIFGLLKIVEGLKLSHFENQDKMLEIQNEINKSLTIEETLTEVENSNLKNSLKNESDILLHRIKIIAICFISIFFSEAGDKTQFSTVYFTQTSSKILIFASFIIAHFSLITISAGFALGFNRMSSKKAILIISGAIFIYFSIICAHLIYINNYLILNKSNIFAENVLDKKNKLNFLRKL